MNAMREHKDRDLALPNFATSSRSSRFYSPLSSLSIAMTPMIILQSYPGAETYWFMGDK